MTRPALRSKQVRAAKAVGSGLTYTEAGAIVGRSKRTVTRWLQDPELRLIAEREGAVPGEVAPVEMLRTPVPAPATKDLRLWHDCVRAHGDDVRAVAEVAAVRGREDGDEVASGGFEPLVVADEEAPVR